MAGTYLTISPDLVEHADRFAEHLRMDGVRVRIEPSEVAFPSTPTLAGSRGSMRHYVEVASSCRIQALKEWHGYARTRQHETFVTLLVPAGTDVKADALVELRSLGVGLSYSSAAGLQEIIAARDLGLPLSLPLLDQQPTAIQKLLRPIYRKFDRGDWADGFKDACQLVEDLARERFIADHTSGRIQLVRNNKPRVVKKADAERLTLGQLAQTHGEIVAPNNADIVIAKALSAINPDRVGAVHRGNDTRTRAKLRKNVSQHMWTVVNALRSLT